MAACLARVELLIWHVLFHRGCRYRKLVKTYEIIHEIHRLWISPSNFVFPIEVGCRGFITVFLTNLGLPPSDKRKYMEKIQDKALTASAWIWQSHRATTIWQSLMVSWDTAGRPGLVVMMLQPRNHAWSQSHHLMKALLEAMLLYKHQLFYDTYIYIYQRWFWVQSFSGSALRVILSTIFWSNKNSLRTSHLSLVLVKLKNHHEWLF